MDAAYDFNVNDAPQTSGPMLCRVCHYDLHAWTTHTCPECGATFDPDDPSTYLRKVPGPLRRWETAVALLFCAWTCAWCIGVLFYSDTRHYPTAESQAVKELIQDHAFGIITIPVTIGLAIAGFRFGGWLDRIVAGVAGLLAVIVLLLTATELCSLAGWL